MVTLEQESSGEPVYVTEHIPAGGAHGVSEDEAQREGIPLPAHLRVMGEIGRGGMGRVHPATDRRLLRHVALKRLDPTLSGDPFFRDCFVAEAQITGQLEHPNIVPVHELAIDERGAPYFTMKLVLGRTLHDWLQDAEHTPGSGARLEEGIDILLKVCDAVAYAHHRGVIHLDLKPGNIMVASFGQVYVMDWGLARLMRTAPTYPTPTHAQRAGMAGTLEYMAPEQASGNPAVVDERTDVFGIGALLYEVLSGKPPYGGELDPVRLRERVQSGAVVPLEAVTQGLGISKHIRAIAGKATHPNPNQRFQSVLALRDALRTFLRRGLHLPRKAFPQGTQIIREGDLGDEAFIITSGTCRVYRGTGGVQETLATLGPGEVFGEMALLLDETRVASVEALTPVTLLVLSKEIISEELGLGGWAGTLARALARRFRDLELEVWGAKPPP